MGKVRNLVRINLLHIALFISALDYSSVAWWNFTLTNSKAPENTNNIGRLVLTQILINVIFGTIMIHFYITFS